jgi:hypothetical protein
MAIDHFDSRCGSVRIPLRLDIVMKLGGFYAPQILGATGAGEHHYVLT